MSFYGFELILLYNTIIMLDIQFIRQHLDEVRYAITHKHRDVDLDRLLVLDDQRKSLQTQIDDLRAQQKQAGSDRDFDKASTLKQEILSLDKTYQQVLSDYNDLMLRIPQIIHPDAPLGASDADNVEERTRGSLPQFDFEYQDHVSLMQKNKMIDIERGVKLG